MCGGFPNTVVKWVGVFFTLLIVDIVALQKGLPPPAEQISVWAPSLIHILRRHMDQLAIL